MDKVQFRFGYAVIPAMDAQPAVVSKKAKRERPRVIGGGQPCRSTAPRLYGLALLYAVARAVLQRLTLLKIGLSGRLGVTAAALVETQTSCAPLTMARCNGK